MHDNSYKNWNVMDDVAIEREIGRYIKKLRQDQNKTQDQLAKAANISRSTLSLLERGESGNLKTLIQILRVLGKLELLQIFEYQEQLSPLALAKEQHTKYRTRVRPSKKKTDTKSKKSNW